MLTDSGALAVMQALSEIRLDTVQSFTAYDVTKAARSLTDENIRHSDVRDLVHALYENDFLEDYFRAAHTFWIDGRQETAQLFTPLGTDPNDYDPGNIQLEKQSAVSQAIQNVTGATSLGSHGVIGVTGFQSVPNMPSFEEGTSGVTGVQSTPCQVSDEDEPFTPITKAIPAEPADHPPIKAPQPDPAFKVTASGAVQVDPMALVRKIKDRISQLPIPRLWKGNQ